MNNSNTPREVQILLVEDNPGDVGLTEAALEESKILNTLHVVNDGEAAISFLRREGDNSYAPRPDLILLDLNLPKKDGREVLSEIKTDPQLKRIPVVVLTASDAEKDIAASYDLQANCYVSKPLDLDSFVQVISAIEEFWLAIVKLPPT